MRLWTIYRKESRDAPPQELGTVAVEMAGALPFKVRLLELGQRAPDRWPRYIVRESGSKERGK